jgi:hypothetical protein
LKIEINSCVDLFEKLGYEKSKLDKEWNPFDFFNFTVTAWHLHHDWLNNDKSNRPTLAMRKVDQALPQIKEVVMIARDLSNGSKHFQLNKPNMKKKVVEKIHDPEIRDWHSYFYRPKHGISTKSAYYSTADFIFLLYEYLAWVMSDNQSAEVMPEKIVKHLDSCKVTNA